MTKSYKQYCPVAHALDVVGERWSLLIVRELVHGPLRYTDLLDRLEGCGSNILAARLRHLEAAGVLHKRKLPPPAASTVYELTEYGQGLKTCLRELAWWGARSLGPPSPGDLEPGWLGNALTMIGPAPAGLPSVELRIDGEVVGLANGGVVEGGVADPDVLVEGDPAGFFHLLVDRDLDGVRISGDRADLERILDAIGPPAPAPAPAA